MDVILLAGGYATRMFPLTKSQPKHLLTVGTKPVIDYLVEQLKERDEVKNVYVVTNNKFHQHFVTWSNGKEVTVINDGTVSNDDRLGAIGDTQFVIDKFELKGPILVMAADTIFETAVHEVLDEFKQNEMPLNIIYDLKEKVPNKYGIVELSEEGLITDFEEKPDNPKSTLKGCPMYLFPKQTVPLIKQYLQNGNNNDAPGYFVEWLHKQVPVKGVVTKGELWDIGCIKSYESTHNYFLEKGK
ncbi:hypothetical protein CL622_07855 [archaeon]|nr:hypothetical protein [archaeon]|tara:strand:+ start:1003 stop:1731 length:729 start_codon:yes stop_codon:yes gene_type:complete